MDTVLDLLGVALAWIFYGLTIVGLGALFLGLSCRAALLSFSCCFWVGLALLVTALQIFNLYWGINLFVVRPTCVLGLFCFWLFRKRLNVSFWHRLKPWYILPAGLVILWVADRALGEPGVYDSGLYHFSSVRWANEQPLPPGLGNLHGRLAFNQSYFLFVSFLNLLPKRDDGHNFTNSLLLVFTIITILEMCSEATADRTRKTVFLLLGILVFFFALLFNKTNPPGISSPSPDVAMVCLQLAMFSLALAALQPKCTKRCTADQTGRAGSSVRYSKKTANHPSRGSALAFGIGCHFQIEFNRIFFRHCSVGDRCLFVQPRAEKPFRHHRGVARHGPGFECRLGRKECDCQRISDLSDNSDCLPSPMEGAARSSNR